MASGSIASKAIHGSTSTNFTASQLVKPTRRASATAIFVIGYLSCDLVSPQVGHTSDCDTSLHSRVLFSPAFDKTLTVSHSPKTAVIPTPASNTIPRAKRLPPFPSLPHADTTYIGNIAFELIPINDVLTGNHKNFYQGPLPLRIPPDQVFTWPNYEDTKIREELDGWVALLFYEIAPQYVYFTEANRANLTHIRYWGQGLMKEAMLAAAEFVFFELGLGYVSKRVTFSCSCSTIHRLLLTLKWRTNLPYP